jgi:hypothetical protein
VPLRGELIWFPSHCLLVASSTSPNTSPEHFNDRLQI